METVEIIVYMGVAVMIGALLIAFTVQIGDETLVQKVRRIVMPDQDVGFAQVSSDEVAGKAFELWQACAYGAQPMNRTLHVKSGDPITKASLFATYVKLNLCYSIQSAEQGCGTREDVDVAPGITPPLVLGIACLPNGTLVIS